MRQKMEKQIEKENLLKKQQKQFQTNIQEESIKLFEKLQGKNIRQKPKVSLIPNAKLKIHDYIFNNIFSEKDC